MATSNPVTAKHANSHVNIHAADLIGAQLGPYLIEQLIGSGGMSEVYRAQQPSIGRQVALKVLPAHLSTQPAFQERFRREALLIAGLQHTHIVPVFDYGQSAGRAYLVMPLLENGTIAARVRGRRLPVDEIVRVGTQVGDALAYAHARGMVHRDVKPGNILLDARGNCLLADFGIAALFSEHPGSGPVGTPGYMSPEQAQGEPLDARHDLYSLAVLLYELAAGRRLFAADTRFETLRQHALTPPTPLRALDPTFPVAIDQVILRALNKQPSDRQDSAAEFVRALREGDAERHARPDAPQPRRRARVKPVKPAVLTAPQAPSESPVGHRKPMLPQLRWRVILAVLAACACIAAAGININTALKSDQIPIIFRP